MRVRRDVIFGLLDVAAMPASVTWLLVPSRMVDVGSAVLASCDFNDDDDIEGAGELAGGVRVKWAAMGNGIARRLLKGL